MIHARTLPQLKIGVLGAGQLGKMLIQDASKMHIDLALMDTNRDAPGARLCPGFTVGDIQSYDDVLAFGKGMDIVTIEIEAVNDEALAALVDSGVEVYPQPHLLRMIKDKGLQKQYYRDHNLASSDFALYDDDRQIRAAVADGVLALPFVQKARTGGYDGKGVHVVRSTSDLEALLPVPSICEDLVAIDKELAVIVARSTTGEARAFEVAEMEFHPTANLVECLFTPARVGSDTQAAAKALAIRLAEQMEIVGLLAVELFLTEDGDLLINEVAPRPHNSGHHTIEGAVTSQFEQHIRAIIGMPLGDTRVLEPAAMVNLLGHPDHTGPTVYAHIDECLAMPGAHLHLYGKDTTKPYRKMGHATVTDPDLETAITRAKKLRETLQIISTKSNNQ